jgi:hypothetical protein
MSNQIPVRTGGDAKQSRDPEPITGRFHRRVSSKWRIVFQTLSVVVVVTILADPVAAQSSGTAFCATDMATTIRNVFTLIQFGGPLVGGTIALGAIVATPYVRRADAKREIKEVRNQAIIWGLIVAPLATTIVGFLLNEVVAGGASCGF